MSGMPPSPKWTPFMEWLERQRADAVDSSPPDPPAPACAAAAFSPCHAAPTHVESLYTDPAFPRDCRVETRAAQGSCRESRQDTTIALTAPGMPLHKCPLITARQASSLLVTLCEPLMRVEVGRMTRQLEGPTLLHPTPDRGVLSLWLLPNDDLSLVWQGRITPDADLALPVEATRGLSHVATEVTMWEELAKFPFGAEQDLGDPSITIHMLRGDASGRTFYLRPRGDAAAAGADTGSPGVKDRRMYFWLTDNDVEVAVRNLGRLKSLIKRPPTLSKRSGVPQHQLEQIGDWLHQLDTASAQHVGANTCASNSMEALLGRCASVAASPPCSAASPGLSPAHFDPSQLMATGAVSATAAAAFKDRRFQICCPCTITIGVTVSLGCNPSDPSVAVAEATSRALQLYATQEAARISEGVARRTVDRLGRLHLEEAICETLIRSMREQRVRARAEVQARRRAQSAALQAQAVQRAVQGAAAHAEVRPQSCKLALQMELAAADVATAAVSAAASELLPVSPMNWQGSQDSVQEEGSTDESSTEDLRMPPRPGRKPKTCPSPGGRVTVGDLAGLFEAASLEPDGSDSDDPRGPSKAVRVDDLPDLLNFRPARK